jgi:acyl-CoA dehydrogenase
MLERSEYFTKDHALFAETVRRFIAREIAPYHAQWEEVGVVPRELFLRAGALGRIAGGASEVMKQIIARELYGN